jgi:hypothetical protein
MQKKGNANCKTLQAVSDTTNVSVKEMVLEMSSCYIHARIQLYHCKLETAEITEHTPLYNTGN